VGAAVVANARAHSPYGRWRLLRQTHLLIYSTQQDLAGDEFAEAVVRVVQRELPESRAMVARARTLSRLGSLISSGQGSVAVLSHADALAAVRGSDAFAEFGPIALAGLVQNDAHLLVCRSDFPARHAYMVAGCLLSAGADLVVQTASVNTELAPHPGVLAFARGDPLPPLDGE
jgi:hypothetical protein